MGAAKQEQIQAHARAIAALLYDETAPEQLTTLEGVNGAGLFSTDALIVNWLDASVLSLQAKQVMGLEKAYQASASQKESVRVDE